MEIEKDNILREIELKEKQKEDYLKNYNKELERLEHDKDEFLATNQSVIDELNLKLQFKLKALDNASEEQRALEQQKARDELIQRGVRAMDIDKQLEADMEEYCLKYKITDWNQEIQDMTNDILRGIYGYDKK